MRTKKAVYNFLVEGGFQILISLVGFIRIKLILDILGDSILGAYQLFGQLLAYVSLAELGLTTAIAFSLYKPISEKNHDKINQILSGTKNVFKIVILIMSVVGIIISFNINALIKNSDISLIYLQICFILMVIANIVTYFVTPRAVLFDAEQNKYMYAKYTQLASFVKTLLELVVIIIFKNILAVIIVNIISSIVQNIIIYKMSKKIHSYLDLNAKPDYSFWKKTKDLIPHKIGMLISNNIDLIIISKALGFVQVVTYTSYMYVINTLSVVLGKISTATLSGIGNLLVTNKEKYYDSFLEYNSFVFFLATIICIPLFFEISPFIELVYGAKYIVNTFTCFLFIFIVFYNIIRNALNVYCNAAGLFKETIICVFIEVMINLPLSVILVKTYGITGVLFATAASYIISEFLIKPFILNKHTFQKRSMFKYYYDCLIYLICVLIIFTILKFITSNFVYSNLLLWFVYGIILFIITFIISVVYYKIIGRNMFFERLINLVKNRNENKI